MEVSLALYKRELLKGSTETFLLYLLAANPMYGYQLVKEMVKRSSGYFRFKKGTLIPAFLDLKSGRTEYPSLSLGHAPESSQN